MLISFTLADAQKFVKGTIVDTQETPLPNVSIRIKNGKIGVISDSNGNYSINASPFDTLIFSMVGIKQEIIAIAGRNIINMKLLPSINKLNEVFVIGYGTQEMKDLTAPITYVKGDELNKQTASNPMLALQGKLSGIHIINSGIPDGKIFVKIRGVGSIGDYANPLYVVDGVFVDNINFLSMTDIEDITILKDASAASIYGVRAANGVILVTTKKGKTNKPVVSYENYFGLQVPVNILPMANKDQYIALINEANENVTGYVPKEASQYTTNTNWYNKLVRNAGMTFHNIDISGNTEKTSFSFGGSYFYQEGIMDAKNDYDRFNFRSRVDYKVSRSVNAGINTILSQYKKYIPNEAAFFSAYVNPPLYPVYDEKNSNAYPIKYGSPQQYGFGNQYGNPVATARYPETFEKGNNLIFNIYTEFNIIEDKLIFKTSYNQYLNNWNTRVYIPEFYVGGSQSVQESMLSKTSGNTSKQIIDNLLTYRNKLDKHEYTILLGQSTRMERSEFLTGSALNVPGIDDQSKYLVTGSSGNRDATDGGSRFNGLSFFSRASYNYSGKYLLTLTMRADASSKYQQRWGYFPSVGIGWILSNENFMEKQKSFEFIKIRASWGLLGNDNVPANSFVILGTNGALSSAVFGDKLVDGIGAQTVAQKYLKWEVADEFDFGVDFATFGKLSGQIDYYYKVTKNVVFYAPIATGGGAGELLGNNGSVLNSGVEINLSRKGKFTDNVNYQCGINLTTIHNKVLELNGREYIPAVYIRGDYTTLTQVGHPIGSFYGYEIAGVYKTEREALEDPVYQTIKDKGFFKYKDQNNDNEINEKDKVFLGSAIPWLVGGIFLDMSYKKFDFSFGVQGQLGNKILNAKRMNRDMFVDGNYDKDFYDNHWTIADKSSKYPSAEAYNYSFTQQANNFFVENGSYISIQNVQVGYTIDKIKFFSKLRIYLSAQRPFTFFTYKGVTPEIGGDPISSGIDNSTYPMQAIYSFGLKINF